MVGLGVYLLVAASSVSPTAMPGHAERADVACTYDQAACDLGDVGECDPPARVPVAADLELALDLPPGDAGAVSRAPEVDARRRIIETCDMPRGPKPGARYFTLRTAGRTLRLGGLTAWSSAPVSAPPRSYDMPLLTTVHPAPRLAVARQAWLVRAEARPRAVPASRLERPPTV